MVLSEDIKFMIALGLVPGVGGVNARNLLNYFGSAEAVFNAKESELIKVPGIGSVTAGYICKRDAIAKADKEMAFIDRHKVRALPYTADDYPGLLKHCVDAPIVLFVAGNVDFSVDKTVAVVGTRNATRYGCDFCDELIGNMAKRGDYCVVSGLAYGIDVAAHKACIKYGVPTIGALGHGLDRIYPSLHRSVATKMCANGGLVSDFISGTPIERQNFLRRNRIIAGLARAVIVVESWKTGGALITADIADSYDRDVFAVPGRTSDKYSYGCNELIKRNKAALIENIDDFEYFMSWKKDIDPPQAIQTQLFDDLSPEESKIAGMLRGRTAHIDELCAEADMPAGLVSSALLSLELNGLVVSLPGKMYKLR